MAASVGFFLLSIAPAAFGKQANDRIGVGYTWSNPEDSTLDNQGAIDAYYRVQLTPEIQIGPTLEVIFNPVRNPDEDTVTVWGFRTRIEL